MTSMTSRTCWVTLKSKINSLWVYFENDCFILQTNIQIDKMGLQALLLPSYLISLEKDLFLVQDTDPNTI